MNQIRRIMGIVWILLAIVAGYYLIVSQAIPKSRPARLTIRVSSRFTHNRPNGSFDHANL